MNICLIKTKKKKKKKKSIFQHGTYTCKISINKVHLILFIRV